MTLREIFIQELMALLSAAPSFPAQVERSIAVAFSRDESPVLVIHRGAEGVEADLSGEAIRECEILVSIITRSDVPDQQADSVMEAAHPLLMAYQSDSLLQIWEEGTNAPMFANADAQACMLTTRYRVQYRTDRLSLSA